MANYANILAQIAAAITTNDNEEITGAVLRNVLLDMVATLGNGYQFKGLASPSDTPGTPDAKVWYMAPEGSYENYGASANAPFVVDAGQIGVIRWDSAWTRETVSIASTIEVIDNFVDGGATNALSAEAGKQLYATLFGGDVATEEVNIQGSFSWTVQKFIVAANPESDPVLVIGSMLSSSSTSSKACDYVDISSFVKLKITLPYMASATSSPGLCFYDASYNVVQAVWRANLSPASMTEETLTIPSGAKYVRTTWREDYGSFSCYGIGYTQTGGILNNLEAAGQTSTDLTSQFTWTSSKYRSQVDGALVTSGSSRSYGSNLVNVGEFDKLSIYVPQFNLAQTNAGWAFYDKNQAFLVGDALIGSSMTMRQVTLNIPRDAVYFATTKRTDGVYTGFSCYGIKKARYGYANVAGSASESMADVANVQEYGAVGDGVVDDTAAILYAMNSGAKKVYFPAGTYLMGKTIVLPSGIEFYGDGIGVSIIKFLGASNAVQTGATRYDMHYWRSNAIYTLIHTQQNGANLFIHDIELDGSDFTNSERRYIGLSLCRISDSRVENVYVHHINYDMTRDPSAQFEYGYNIFIWEESTRVAVSSCASDNAGYENIGTEDVTDVTIRDSYWGNGWRTSVQLHRGTRRTRVVNNTINNSSTTAHASLTIHGVTDNYIEDIFVGGNTILSTTNESQGNRGGISFVQSGFRNIRIAGNAFDGNSFCMVDLLTDGTSATWPRDLIITGNRFVNSRYGIRLQRGNNYIIQDNIIDTVSEAVNINVTNYIVKDNILPTNTTKTLAGTAWTD